MTKMLQADERKRMAAAIAVSIAAHALLLTVDGTGSRTRPRLNLRQFPRRVTLDLLARPAPRPVGKTARKQPLRTKAAPGAVKPVTRAIREIPAPPPPSLPPGTGPAVMTTPAAVNIKVPHKEKKAGKPGKAAVARKKNAREAFAPTVLARPMYRRNPPPEYPLRARLMRWQGTVMITARVNAAGRVEKAWIAQTSGHRVLDRSALAAVRGWLFSPAARNGTAVPCEVTVPVRFVIR